MSSARAKITMVALKKALVRAVNDHGHHHNCSAARGMESDCTCGWLEVRQMVKRITPIKKPESN